MLSVIMLSVANESIISSTVMLSVIMLNVNMLSVVAPFKLPPLTFKILKMCKINIFEVNNISKHFTRMCSS